MLFIFYVDQGGGEVLNKDEFFVVLIIYRNIELSEFLLVYQNIFFGKIVCSKRDYIEEVFLQYRDFGIIILKVDIMKYVIKESFFMIVFRLVSYDKIIFMLFEYIFCLVLYVF